MKPTLEQQGNLLKLAKGLAALPVNYKHFSMQHYCVKDGCNDYKSYNPDNTAFGAACRIVKFLENDCKVPKNGIPF